MDLGQGCWSDLLNHNSCFLRSRLLLPVVVWKRRIWQSLLYLFDTDLYSRTCFAVRLGRAAVARESRRFGPIGPPRSAFRRLESGLDIPVANTPTAKIRLSVLGRVTLQPISGCSGAGIARFEREIPLAN